MTVLTVAYNVISPIALIIGLSALASRYLEIAPRTVSSLIIYLFSPMLVLHSMTYTELQPGDLLHIIGVALLLSVVMSVIGFGAARVLKLDRRTESAFVMTIVLMNAGNYGIPLNEFAYGVPGADRAMVYYIASALLGNTYGVFLASRGTASARDSILNVFKLPLIYCLGLGLILNFSGVELPVPLERSSYLLGSAAVPAMLTLLGMQLARASLRGRIAPVLAASGLRLLVAPVIALGLAVMLGITGLTKDVIIVESAMPTAVITSALAIQFDADGDFVAAAILISTAASVITLSVLLALLGAA
ncbi:MAG: AEC family transporter [Anaerolineae bacterium]|nr:AEC family transporter [Anaerolineae bacterium]